MESRPTGIVSFLFTDVQGSTRLWERESGRMNLALARHDQLVQVAISEHRGVVFSTAGDSFAAAFDTADLALAAAATAQRLLDAEEWPTSAPIRVRMGVHTGTAQERDGNYFGPTLNRTARIMAAAHGGQVLVSDVTAALVDGGTWRLVDLGRCRLKDLEVPARVWQLGSGDFPLVGLGATGGTRRFAHSDPMRGRSIELELLASLLGTVPLLSVVGPGGVGKTRLVVELLGTLSGDLRSVFVDLSEVRDPASVDSAVAATLGVEIGARLNVRSALIEYLSAAPQLVVFDNCEHAAATVGDLASAIVAGCPRTWLLATSRVPLRVTGERVVRLGPLPVGPEKDDGTFLALPSIVALPAVPSMAVLSPAAQLFCDAARRAGCELEMNPTAAATVSELCRNLDGLPLAIELAASRLPVFSLADLRKRLDRRLDLLVAPHLDGRHSTLRATIDWSYELLSEDARRLHRFLSLLPSGAVLDAVEWLGPDLGLRADPVLVISELVDASMVFAEDHPSGRRFIQLETMRAHGAELLRSENEYGAALALTARWALMLLEQVPTALVGPDEAVWDDRVRFGVNWPTFGSPADIL